MLSDLHLKTFEWSMKLSNFSGTCPFVWNSTKRKATVIDKSRLKCAVHGVIVSSYGAALALLALDKEVSGDIDLFIFTVGIFCVCLVALIIYTVFIFKSDTAVVFINETICWLTHFQSKCFQILMNFPSILNLRQSTIEIIVFKILLCL